MEFQAKGKVKPGSTVEFLFPTFDSNDPSASVTTTIAVGDVKVYKDGGTTARASTAGFTVDNDFATVTGIHRVSIDLSDNTTANFYEAGSTYIVAIDTITVDAGVISFPLGGFIIGYGGAILDTTIATLTSQTSFTLEDGPTEADVFNGCPCLIHDLASATQIALGYISDYAVTTRTVTLAADPGIFTMAAGDNISIFMPSQVASWNNVPLATTNPLPNAAPDSSGGLATEDASGHLAVDVREWLGTAVTISATSAKPEVDVNSVSDDAVAANNLELDYDGTGYAKTNSTMGTVTTLTGHTAQTGDSFARLGAPAGASVSADIAAVKAETNSLDGTKIPDTLSLANIQTEVESALEDTGQTAVVTTIATLTSQTSFTLTAGSTDNNAYRHCIAVIEDSATAAQKAYGIISAYTGSTRTITLAADPAIFTMAVGDKITILWPVVIGGWLAAVVNTLVSGRVDSSVGAIADNAITDTSIAADAITAAKIAADAIGASELATDAVNEIVDQVWDEAIADHVAAGSMGLQLGTDVDAILVDTNSLNDTKIPDTISLAAINAEVDSALDTAVPVSPTADSINERLKTLDDHDLVTKIPDTLSLANINAEVDTAFTTQMADSVSTDGAIATREQALYMMLQMLTDFSIAGTTLTVRKVDGSTTLMTFTLDDGTNPTDLTRTS